MFFTFDLVNRYYLYFVDTGPSDTEVFLHKGVGGCQGLHLDLQVVDRGAVIRQYFIFLQGN